MLYCAVLVLLQYSTVPVLYFMLYCAVLVLLQYCAVLVLLQYCAVLLPLQYCALFHAVLYITSCCTALHWYCNSTAIPIEAMLSPLVSLKNKK